LAPLPNGLRASQCCFSEDASGRLVLLRYDALSGSADFSRLVPSSAERAEVSAWTLEPLGAVQLLPRRDMRFVPVPICSAPGVVAVLQYDVESSYASGWSLGAKGREGGLLATRCWDSWWVLGNFNQQLARFNGHCCLVEFNPTSHQLNVGRFTDRGEYTVAGYLRGDGEWWRCDVSAAVEIHGIWPPVRADEGAVAVLKGSSGGLVLCGLPADLSRPDEGEWELEESDPAWMLYLTGPLQAELRLAVKEGNWRQRRMAVLLSSPRGSHGSAAAQLVWGEAVPLRLLAELRAQREGLWRRIVAML
jgi:hypothetical protein